MKMLFVDLYLKFNTKDWAKVTGGYSQHDDWPAEFLFDLAVRGCKKGARQNRILKLDRHGDATEATLRDLGSEAALELCVYHEHAPRARCHCTNSSDKNHIQ